MIDGVPSASGQGYLIKSIASFLASYPTYSEFVSALVAGTLPIDISFNSPGWSTQPTPLNKANLLDDTVAAALKTLAGLSSDPATPNAALSALATAVAGGAKIATGSYTGNGLYGSSHPCSLTFNFVPKAIFLHGPANYNNSARIFEAALKPFAIMEMDNGAENQVTTWGTNRISWYATSNDYDQLNHSGYSYSYTVLG